MRMTFDNLQDGLKQVPSMGDEDVVMLENQHVRGGKLIFDTHAREILYHPNDIYRVMGMTGYTTDQMFERAKRVVEHHIEVTAHNLCLQDNLLRSKAQSEPS